MQLDLFKDNSIKSKSKRKRGRPSEITEEKIFAIMDDIKRQTTNKKLTNKKIIQKHNISERTFYRIKSGDKKYLKQFQSAIEKKSQEFCLLSD